MQVRQLKYRHHASGQAFVRIRGKDFYLGKYGTSESKEAYRRIINEYLARQEMPPAKTLIGGPSVNDVMLAYLNFAKTYYVKNGKVTAEVEKIIYSLRPLKKLYGNTPAQGFDFAKLKAVRKAMIECDLCRNTVNQRINVLKRMIRWAASEGLIPPSVHTDLSCVGSLNKYRSAARESKPVNPVDVAEVEKVLPFMPHILQAMVRLQMLTGMRSAELAGLRPCDLDCSQDIWLYKPQSHKNDYRGQERIIPLGPKCQELIKPYLNGVLDKPIFSPQIAMAQRRAEARAKRKTRVQPSQVYRRKLNPKKKRGEVYDRHSYHKAVLYAIYKTRKAGVAVKHWHPHQLRHSIAEKVEREMDLEHARAYLGHSSVRMTKHYAGLNQALAIETARKVG